VPAAGSLPLVDLATLDLLPDAAWVATPETGLAHFNTAWLAMTGMSARVQSIDEFLALVHPDDREIPRRDWRAARDAPGTTASSHFRIRCADGAYRWFLMRAVPVHRDATVAGWVATITDVDVERRIREELVASEARARSIADAIPQLIGITSADGSLISVNERYTAYTGKTIDEIRETAWTSTIHPDDVEQMVAQWERAVVVGEPHDTQYRLRGRDGIYRWFLNKAIPVRDAAGAVTAWIATATDIDERKRAEDALRVVVEASTAFAGTLDASVVLQHLADVSAAHVADWCGVYLYDAAERLRAVAIAHRDPEKVRFVREYLRRYPIRDQDAAALVASTGIPLRVDEITDDMYDAIEDEEERGLARSLGLRSVLYVPLGDDQQRYGVFSLAIAESNRRFTDEDQQLATLIAQRASIAVANARLYERQREVAGTLQAAFLPPALPHTAAVSFDATYAAGTRDHTTRLPAVTVRLRSRSATSPAAASKPRSRWARCVRRSVRWACSRTIRRAGSSSPTRSCATNIRTSSSPRSSPHTNRTRAGCAMQTPVTRRRSSARSTERWHGSTRPAFRWGWVTSTRRAPARTASPMATCWWRSPTA